MAFQWTNCLWTLVTSIYLIDAASSVGLDPVYMCDSKIYCQGPILEAVNRLHIFNDSKHYVDMPLKQSVNETLAAFSRQFPNPENITKEGLVQFLDEHYIEPGGELMNCTQEDWKEEPDNFKLIKDPKYRQWAKDLQLVWLKLCRRINDSLLKDFERNSLIYVPNPFIAPGGRYREYYYWDTYWIVKGLLMSEMYDTVKGIIRNFAYVVNEIGFIPNGGRMYYLQRSQPPFFIPMVYDYYMETNDLDLVREVMPAMEKELLFWRANRSVTLDRDGKNYTLYRYLTPSNTPRPESYREDLATASALNDAGQQRQLYQDIATAAESGFDFGGRFFRNHKDMITIHTSEVLPVDLNAIICWDYHILHLFHHHLGNEDKARDIFFQWDELRDGLDLFFYNETAGSWFDIDSKTRAHIAEFYASNAVPVFTGCYDTLDTSKAKKVYEYFKKSGGLSFPSGIPSSLVATGQQWDLPNGWPPQNHMVIEGFRKSDHEEIQENAFQIASAWLRVNYLVYKKTGHMYEKYNVTDTTYQPGGGGEYEVQVGFGWSNGVVLDLLRTYGSRLVAPDDEGYSADHSNLTAASTSAAPSNYGVPSTWTLNGCLFFALFTIIMQW